MGERGESVRLWRYYGAKSRRVFAPIKPLDGRLRALTHILPPYPLLFQTRDLLLFESSPLSTDMKICLKQQLQVNPPNFQRIAEMA